MTTFQPLEVHSMHSMGQGTLRLEEIFALAKASGDAFVSITDTNSFAGLVNMLQGAKTAGFKALVGVRLKQGEFSVLCFARSMRGYARLSHLVSRINLEEGFSLEKEMLAGPPEACFVVTGHRPLLEARHPGTFAEISPYGTGYGDTWRLARELGVPPVLVPPVYFKDAADFETHRVLAAISQAKNLWDLKDGEVQPAQAFYPVKGRFRDDLLSRFAPMPDAIANTVALAEAAHFEFTLGELHFPKLEGDSFDRLRSKCLANAPLRYKTLTPAVRDRLAHELGIIRKMGFCDYFLVVEDIVKHGGMYTCGRGSGAASLVAYLLFITHVDPIAHNLYFERFLNEERKDPPDIDIDFAWDEKDRITQYCFDAHGKKCARVSNHIRYSSRSALHEVAKLFGVPEKEIMAMTKHVAHYYDKHKDEWIDVGEAAMGPQSKETWTNIVRLAKRLDGLPRYLGLHCGGTVVVPRSVSYYTPVYMSAKGFPAIQWEKDQTEDFGLVKIDLLGNRSLAVVRDALNALRENQGLDIKYEYMDPLDDPPTQAALARGETLGVFYVESPAMRQLQKKTGVGDYEHLVIHSSIIRPAANDFINDYIRRLKGEPWTPLLPEMGSLMKETYGIMVYQEDISRLAVAVGAFTVGEGEELRKVIGSPRKTKRKEELKAKLMANMGARGIDPEIIQKVWTMIESFAGYSFCKPHSASYAQLSFKACWLKVHHPAEFMAAVLSNQGGFYGPSAYLAEARRMGLSVQPPDINLSRRPYTGDRKTLTVGFMVIKDLASATVDRLIAEREKGGAYAGLADFMARTGASLIETRTLIRAGCFDRLEGPEHPRLLFAAAKLDGMRGLSGLLATEEASLTALTGGLSFKVPSWEERKEAELAVFGFILSVHPMLYWGRKDPMSRRTLARDVARHGGKHITLYGVLITTKTVQTVHDDLMKFVTFEDESGLIECVLFPKPYQKYAKGLEVLAPYRVTGVVDVEFDTWILRVETIEPMGKGNAPRKAGPGGAFPSVPVMGPAGKGEERLRPSA